MFLDPILSAPVAVQIHAIAAVEAIVLLPFMLLRKKRDRLHKTVGYAWVTNMLVAAFLSFWITEIELIGPFSPIHLLSLFVIYNMWRSVQAARRRRIREHEAIMKQTALWGLGVAGAFTLLPGRVMNEMLFGPITRDGFSSAPLFSVALFVVATAYVVLRVNRMRVAK